MRLVCGDGMRELTYGWNLEMQMCVARAAFTKESNRQPKQMRQSSSVWVSIAALESRHLPLIFGLPVLLME